MSPDDFTEARIAANQLEEARSRLNEDLRRAAQVFEGLPDASAPLTPRTKLVLRSSRLFVERRGTLYDLHDPQVPTDVKVLAAHALASLHEQVTHPEEPGSRCLHHDPTTNTLCTRLRPCALHGGIRPRRSRHKHETRPAPLAPKEPSTPHPVSEQLHTWRPERACLPWHCWKGPPEGPFTSRCGIRRAKLHAPDRDWERPPKPTRCPRCDEAERRSANARHSLPDTRRR